MRGFRLSCLTDNGCKNRPWGKLWGKMRSERDLKYVPVVR